MALREEVSFTFRHKEYVFAIVETGSFTKAAEKLFVSQPSLSATIKRLEEKIGAPIFDRSSTPVSLTETGEEYFKRATRIRELERDFEKYVADYGNVAAGKIRVGGSSFFCSIVLPRMISEFKKNSPKIEFEIFEDNTKDLLAKLRENDLDVIVDYAATDEENVSSEIYKEERILLAVPKKFEINKKLSQYALSAEQIKADEHLRAKSVDLSKFKNETFVLLRRGNDTGKRAEKLFKKHEINPKIVFYLDQQVTSYNVASTGLGICFVGDTLVKGLGASPEVVYYALGDRLTVRNVYLHYRKNGYLSAACKKFIEENAKR